MHCTHVRVSKTRRRNPNEDNKIKMTKNEHKTKKTKKKNTKQWMQNKDIVVDRFAFAFVVLVKWIAGQGISDNRKCWIDCWKMIEWPLENQLLPIMITNGKNECVCVWVCVCVHNLPWFDYFAIDVWFQYQKINWLCATHALRPSLSTSTM